MSCSDRVSCSRRLIMQQLDTINDDPIIDDIIIDVLVPADI